MGRLDAIDVISVARAERVSSKGVVASDITDRHISGVMDYRGDLNRQGADIWSTIRKLRWLRNGPLVIEPKQLLVLVQEYCTGGLRKHSDNYILWLGCYFLCCDKLKNRPTPNSFHFPRMIIYPNILQMALIRSQTPRPRSRPDTSGPYKYLRPVRFA